LLLLYGYGYGFGFGQKSAILALSLLSVLNSARKAPLKKKTLLAIARSSFFLKGYYLI